MPLFVSNTLSGLKEEFVPLNPGKAGLYTCGPPFTTSSTSATSAPSSGRISSAALEFSGLQVTHVMNITDVDDKTIRTAPRRGLAEEFTDRYTEYFLRIYAPAREAGPPLPRATDFIPRWWRSFRVDGEGVHLHLRGGFRLFPHAQFKEYAAWRSWTWRGSSPGPRGGG